ncbi:MAG: hypothetical protein AAF481_17270 [Acidobacteriota bacterium]
MSEPALFDVLLGLNGFGLNWLDSHGSQDTPAVLESWLCESVSTPNIATLGRVLRGEVHATSWLNTEKQLARHRILSVFHSVLLRDRGPLAAAIVGELIETVTSRSATVTLDVRGQSLDLLEDWIPRVPADVIEGALRPVEDAVGGFSPCVERDTVEQLMECHDTIDPHIDVPVAPVLDVLFKASLAKARERAFVLGRRLTRVLQQGSSRFGPWADALLARTEEESELLRSVTKGVLTAPPFKEFIAARLPSRSSSVDDYAVNRHQVISDGLTIHELCRVLIAAPENASSDRRSRQVITCFFRQVLGLGQAANVGLEARPFFIDHGFGSDGVRLDWPSYVFLPAGVIWGKGAGVDLSCGVAFGGGVDQRSQSGRDGAYIGGSWSSTLYHGHSHVGGEDQSQGAESRDRIIPYGLTVEDGRRLPWGRYVEAEDNVEGTKYPGVRTFRLAPEC